MNHDATRRLNEIIETSKDGEQGFLKSARDASTAELSALFTQCAQRCADGACELQSLVRDMGGDPEKSDRATAVLHRGWMSVKEAVSSRDDKAIVEEVDRGADYAKDQYRQALQQDLPAHVRAVVERQYQGVVADHYQVRALRGRIAARRTKHSRTARRQPWFGLSAIQ